MSIPYVYDAGALIAIGNNDRRMWAIHHLAVEEARRIVVPAVVIGQASRDPRRQARLNALLHTCQIEPIGPEVSKAAGVLCGRAGTSDIVDAIVTVIALTLGAVVFTSDPKHILALAAESAAKPGLVIKTV